MKYFIERNNLLNNNFSLDLQQLKKYFFQTYRYFEERGFFEVAFSGVFKKDPYSYREKQVLPPSMSPTPEIYFMNHLRKTKIYPIFEFYQKYTEEELFSVIEILFNHICFYDDEKNEYISTDAQEEFATHMNNLLRFYKGGYYLDTKYGFILEQPNDAVVELLNTKIPNETEEIVVEQLKTAMRMYYRFDANAESKKKAINILADVLEPLREELKILLNEEFGVNKNNHDKLIFDVVNNYNIRHNNGKQLLHYNKAIWYDWMMQYYTSVILTYYRLKNVSN